MQQGKKSNSQNIIAQTRPLNQVQLPWILLSHQCLYCLVKNLPFCNDLMIPSSTLIMHHSITTYDQLSNESIPMPIKDNLHHKHKVTTSTFSVLLTFYSHTDLNSKRHGNISTRNSCGLVLDTSQHHIKMHAHAWADLASQYQWGTNFWRSASMVEPWVIFRGGNFFSVYILFLKIIIHKKLVNIVDIIEFYVRYPRSTIALCIFESIFI